MSRAISAHSPLVAACLATLLLGAAPQVGAQDPVLKPATGGARVNGRLPGPANIVIRQTGDAELTVTWTPVPGAQSYNLGRAVPPNGLQRVADGNGLREARYVDRSVTKGSSVTYTITPIDASGMAGVRSMSEPFTAWQAMPAGGGATTAAPGLSPPNLGAWADGSAVRTGWSHVPGAEEYRVRLIGPTSAARTIPATGRSVEMSFPGVAPGDYVVELMAVDVSTSFVDPERRSPMVRSRTVTIAADASATPSEPPAEMVPSSTVTSRVMTPEGVPLPLRVGQKHRVTARDVQRWVSLTPVIVTVSDDGTMSARMQGTGRVIGYGPAAGGATVTVVEVTVSP